MKTNSPTHEKIAQCAHGIWTSRGHPTGCDTAIWLEAERQLTGDSSGPQHSGPVEAHGSTHACGRNLAAASGGAALPGPIAAGPTAHHWPAPAAPALSPGELAAQAAAQKQAARAPRLPTGKNAPHAAPPESGKPLWDKPHSS